MKYTTTIFVMLLFVACRKHDIDPNQSKTDSIKKYIIAGAKNDCMVYKSFTPPLQAIYDSQQSLKIDINGDGINDIEFYSYEISENPFHRVVLDNKNIDISLLNPIYNIQTDTNYLAIASNSTIKSFNLNDTINNLSGWTTQKDSVYKSGIIKQRRIINIGTMGTIIPQYIGFRFINKTDTLYGWMRTSGNTWGNFLVYEYAYQQK
jgi:hypothetical protein